MLELSGVVLMLAAVLLVLFLGARRSSKTKVTAKQGSAAVGGNANGPIIVTHTGGHRGRATRLGAAVDDRRGCGWHARVCADRPEPVELMP